MIRHVLLANLTLAGRTGTEVVTRDLALGLAANGHRVSVFARTLGPIADELRAAGLPVVDRLEELHARPDIVHGHHFMETIDALGRFPEARGVFVCHDRTAPHSIPPRLARIRRYVAVDLNCLERLRLDWRIPAAQARVILNAVDTARFRPRPPLPPAPVRALVFSHTASATTHLEVVREACARAGLPLEVFGADAGAVVADPEERLGQYDLVFAKGRCALEAMAVGAAVVLCDASGVGPMVTRAELPALRSWNFGARLLREALHPDTLLREMRRYDAADAMAVSQCVRADASLGAAMAEYEAVYEDVMSDGTAPSMPVPELRDAFEPLLVRVGELESALASYRRPERMLPLSDDAVAAIHVSLRSAPSTLAPRGTGFVRVRIQNDSRDQSLGSWPPFPLYWACRWRSADEADFGDEQAERTLFGRGVPPGCPDEFAVKVVAPAKPGAYVARVTLVQEGFRWLDQTATPVFVDVEVTVGSEPEPLQARPTPRLAERS